MRKIILSMQMSLDGYIEGPNGAMDWFAASEEEEQWEGQFDLLSSTDTMLLGGNMYPDYAKYWYSILNNPSAAKSELKYARIADKTQHVVFSRTIDKPVPAGIASQHTRFVKDNLVEEILKLKKQPGKEIVMWGGATIAATFINDNLIDEFRLMVNPVLLGGGKLLFKDANKRHKLQLLEEKRFKSGVVALHFKSTQV